MTGLHIAMLALSLAGFMALALAMPRHARRALRAPLSEPHGRWVRGAGWLLLAIALILAMWGWRFDVGTVTWLGWLSIAGLALVFYLPYWPWQPVAPERPERRLKAKPRSVGWVEERNPTCTQSAGFRRRPAHYYATPRAVLVTAALLIPLVGFAWQLWHAPEKPLLRDDALRSHIGPWTFILAEKDHKPPTVEALGIPFKAFVIQFCEGCESDIRMATLKVRKPHSLRAAGNGFFGRGRDKTAEIPIPPAATLDDGLWLTVESVSGEVYQQHFAIEPLSPALAHYLRTRP